jgi:hypothetical protein
VDRNPQGGTRYRQLRRFGGRRTSFQGRFRYAALRDSPCSCCLERAGAMESHSFISQMNERCLSIQAAFHRADPLSMECPVL